MIIQSHPTGNSYVRQTALGLCEAGLLAEFWTCINWNPDAPLARLLPARATRQFARRTFPPEVRARTRVYPLREMARLLAPALPAALAPALRLDALTRHETGALSVDAVFHALDRRVARRLAGARARGVRGIYAQEDGALLSFKRAQSDGLARFYDLPIGYWRAGHAIYAEEHEREPQWAQTLAGTRDSARKLERKDRELALSDVIFVASSFTRSTLQMAPDSAAILRRTRVFPYGAPPALDEAHWPAPRAAHRPLRVIFVGLLSQRKGLSYLFEAVEKLGKSVELTVVGRLTGSECAPLEAALGRHRYLESLPHEEVLREMRAHDVLVFPSLFEGFGMVITEAMSQGLPVITTPNTAGPDCIEDGRDGFIVPIRSSAAIAEKLTFLSENRDALDAMKRAAWRKAQTLSWQSYRAGQSAAMRDFLNGELAAQEVAAQEVAAQEVATGESA